MAEAGTSTRLSGPDRRAQILAAARHEFLTRGFAGSRIQEVADAAGVTSALIYKHFESKEELFEEAVMAPLRETLAQRVTEMRELPVDSGGGAQRDMTRAIMRTLLEVFSESVGALGVVLFGERDSGREFYLTGLRPLIESLVGASEAILDRWPHREYDIDTLVQAAFGMAFWSALDSSMRETRDDLDLRADRLADVLMDGLIAHPSPRDTDAERD